MRIALLSPAVGSGNVGDHFIEMAIRRLLGEEHELHACSIRRPLTDANIARINESHCAVLCGTNLYQQDWESALTTKQLDLIRVPVIPLGVGTSASSTAARSVSAQTRNMIRALHDKCEIGSVRDPHTAEVVHAAGVHNVAMTGCPVLFWAGESMLPACSSAPKRRVIITARNWLMHHWPDPVDNPVQIDLLQTVLARLSRFDVLFAVHEGFDESLVKALGLGDHQVVRGSTPDTFIALYSDPANVVLAMRLHAGMLSMANGVPAVFVGHDSRTYSFCDMMGTRYVELFDAHAAELASSALETLMRGADAYEEARKRFLPLRNTMRDVLRRNGLVAGPPA